MFERNSNYILPANTLFLINWSTYEREVFSTSICYDYSTFNDNIGVAVAFIIIINIPFPWGI